MNLLKYLFSRYFLRQLFISSIIVSILAFFVFIFLNFNTNHNRYISVPDLVGKNLLESKEILNVYKLKFEISDSTFFDPSFPKFTVLSHFPNANSKVKKNRKIYLTINPTNYSKVAIPEIIQITKRSAISVSRNSEFRKFVLRIGRYQRRNERRCCLSRNFVYSRELLRKRDGRKN